MNKVHSRDVFERGFVVDNKSPCGISVRDNGHVELLGSVDSRQMVKNLAASQQCVKYAWFLTFTANQSEHPGLSNLHKWKSSMQLTENVMHYNALSASEKSEHK